MPFQSIQLTYFFLIELQGAKHVVKVLIAVVNFGTFPSRLCSCFVERSQNSGEIGLLAVPGAAVPCYGSSFWLLVSHLYFAYSNIYSAEHGMWAAYKTECTVV